MMRVAYADPPYVGQARRLYDCAEIDHAALIGSLVEEFPDGWALSCTTNSLRLLLPMCPADVRIAAWVKTWCSYKPGVHPAYAWEPVIFRGGRKKQDRTQPTVRDFVAERASTGRGLAGAKPEKFCHWLFAMLGLRDGDELVDLFPGTGAVTAAWRSYCAQGRLVEIA